MSQPKSRAESLAEQLEKWARDYASTFDTDAMANSAAAELRRLDADNANLRTVMIAAAEEISAHWDAHCDADGYGPVNLLHRLEQGIPSQYIYTAGAWAELKAERDALAAELERVKSAKPLSKEKIEELFEDGLGYEPKTTIVREIEAACAEAWGVKLAGIKEDGNV